MEAVSVNRNTTFLGCTRQMYLTQKEEKEKNPNILHLAFDFLTDWLADSTFFYMKERTS